MAKLTTEEFIKRVRLKQGMSAEKTVNMVSTWKKTSLCGADDRWQFPYEH